MFGTTVDGKGIYLDPHDLYVHVRNIFVDGISISIRNHPETQQEYKWSTLIVEPMAP